MWKQEKRDTSAGKLMYFYSVAGGKHSSSFQEGRGAISVFHTGQNCSSFESRRLQFGNNMMWVLFLMILHCINQSLAEYEEQNMDFSWKCWGRRFQKTGAWRLEMFISPLCKALKLWKYVGWIRDEKKSECWANLLISFFYYQSSFQLLADLWKRSSRILSHAFCVLVAIKSKPTCSPILIWWTRTCTAAQLQINMKLNLAGCTAQTYYSSVCGII